MGHICFGRRHLIMDSAYFWYVGAGVVLDFWFTFELKLFKFLKLFVLLTDFHLYFNLGYSVSFSVTLCWIHWFVFFCVELSHVQTHPHITDIRARTSLVLRTWKPHIYFKPHPLKQFQNPLSGFQIIKKKKLLKALLFSFSP